MVSQTILPEHVGYYGLRPANVEAKTLARCDSIEVASQDIINNIERQHKEVEIIK